MSQPHRSSDGGACRKAVLILGTLALVVVMGCGAREAQSPAATPTAVPSPEGSSPTMAQATATQAPPESSSVDGQVAVTVQPGSVARYRVREQLARLQFPSDAVGETPDVAGSIVFGSDGAVVPEQSKIVVELRSLRSDEERRDNFLRTSSLESARFPQAEFVVREVSGLPWPLPTSGEAPFQMSGDMTVRGVTRPVTWDATASFDGNVVSGQATTSFTFDEFGIAVPQLFFIVSVENNIRAELDFVAAVERAN